ncbi:hypothetical protein [Robbsia andropogonis]|uniref:hypothetical protein n=1 Tax=Robbsia andropogonis TaxID=28092 RepID=UPI0020A0024A|nr:hypothetical protein [Robbsia andropogonis]MCP1119618.1 hypothetical protein [Robbsia andropogonis]MCP1129601.1 hypothetical protein [Robbsia andropogonis]
MTQNGSSATDPLMGVPFVTLRAKHVPWVVGLFLVGGIFTGVTGIYAGSRMQATRNDQEVAALREEIAQQKLDYETRLGTQSARYALDAANFANAVDGFKRALDEMSSTNDRRYAARERAQTQAIDAARAAAQTAKETADKATQILRSQAVVQQQVSESVAAAKATEKKLDSATYPAAQVKSTPWNGER